MYDRHDLYEHCVQSPAELVPLLRALHGADPCALGEDFAGTAALSRAWVAAVDGGRAIAVDHDADVVARTPHRDQVDLRHADVLTVNDAADVIYAGNFSIGEFHTRPALLSYLTHVRTRLTAGGCFVCDLYGGRTAWEPGESQAEWPLPDGSTVIYIWEQGELDPLTATVRNTIHFGGAHAMRDAFQYHWRIWGLTELLDALRDAGFEQTAVFPRTPDAIDADGTAYLMPLSTADDFDADGYDVLVMAR